MQLHRSKAFLIHPIPNRFEHRKCTVPFIQVKNSWRNPQCFHRAEAADAQQQLLANPHASVAAVQARSEFAILRRIARDIGIEQEAGRIGLLESAKPWRRCGHAACLLPLMTGTPFGPIAGSIGSRLTSVCRYSSCCQPFWSSR